MTRYVLYVRIFNLIKIFKHYEDMHFQQSKVDLNLEEIYLSYNGRQEAIL
jgi:hypothetical protein